MAFRSVLLHRLEARWDLRRTRLLPAFGSGLDQTIVVPIDNEGRPGYRLTATAPSSGIRVPSTGQSTSDFVLKYSPRSHLLGVCWGRAESVDLAASAVRAVDHVLADHPGTTCVHPPSASHFAGEPAMTYTIEVRGTQVTDWLFERAGWSFTVGRFHHPKDGSDALDTADRILGSWVWLPDAAGR